MKINARKVVADSVAGNKNKIGLIVIKKPRPAFAGRGFFILQKIFKYLYPPEAI